MKTIQWGGSLLTLTLLLAFVAPMAKRKIMADKTASTVTYAAKHPLHSWDGVSHDVNCAMIYNDETKQPETVAVSIKVATFDSNNNNRDSHAMEVLDGIKYPNVTFTSSDVSMGENGALTAKGTLNFHGSAKPVTLQAVQKLQGNTLTLTGEFPVSLTEYKVERPALMGLKTEDTMTLRFNIIFKL